MATPTNIGRYRVVRRIGSGGMGELYLGVSSGLEGFKKLVAIKRLLPSLSADEEYVGMFLQEARLAATLEHPNIVNVIDVDRDGDDHYLVMSFLEGCSLERVIQRWRKSQKRPDIDFCVAVGLGIAAGLDYAHNKRDLSGTPQQIVHRDVSPHNIFTTYQGEVKLLDFGIAKAASSQIRTAANVRKGKAGYMAPEQCRGKELDARTDIFGLGVVLYELSTLTRPFGDGLDELVVLSKTLEGQFAAPESIIDGYPPELSKIVSRAMDPDPDKRFSSARAMHEALKSFARAQGLDVAPSVTSRVVEATLGPRKPPLDSADVVPTGMTDLAPPPPEFGVTAQSEAPAQADEVVPTTTDAAASFVAPPRRRPGLLIGAAALALGIAGIGWFLSSRGSADPESDEAGRSAAAQPSAPASGPPQAEAPVKETGQESAKADFSGVEPSQLVRLVNQTDLGRALSFKDRHAILSMLEEHPQQLERVDMRLQASLDLRQASEAADPCAAFSAALTVIEGAPDPFYIASLMTASPPNTGSGCDGLGERLAAARGRAEDTVAEQ